MQIFAPVSDYIKGSILTTLNDLLVMGATEPERIGQGSPNYILTTDPSTYKPTWRLIREGLKTILTTKGQIITHNGVIPGAVAIGGSNYMILTSYAGLPTWQNASFTLLGLLTARGDIITRGAAAVERLPLGAAYQILRVNSSGLDLEYFTEDWMDDPFTTKGDLVMAGTSAVPTRKAIGAALQLLRVTAGGDNLEYITPLWIEKSLLTTQGDIIKRGAAANERMAKGAANEILAVNAGGTDLIYKAMPPPAFGSEYSNSNAGVINVGAGATTIVTLDIGTLALGARVSVNIWLYGLKGVTAGVTDLRVAKDSGTGVITFMHDKLETFEIRNLPASDVWAFATSFIGKVTTAGTLVLKLYGTSAGSTFTVSIGNGQLYAWVIKT